MVKRPARDRANQYASRRADQCNAHLYLSLYLLTLTLLLRPSSSKSSTPAPSTPS